jgi:hypothetical protein
VLIGDGHGGFAVGSPIGMAAPPDLLATADVDGDGDLDVLAGGHDLNGVLVMLNDGHGGFTAEPGSPFPAHGPEVRAHTHGLVAGDVNGDGKPDAITANDGNGTLSVLAGDGTGRFSLAPGSPFPVGDQPYFSVLVDLDGDHFLDLVVPNVGADSLAVLKGDGQGGFTHVEGSPFATIVRPYAVAVDDLDRDGRPDIFIAHDDTDRMTILLGREGGRYEPATGSPFTLGDRVWRMATGDFNGDGTLDVAAGSGEHVLLFLGGPGKGQRVELPAKTWTITSGDFDGDGKPDLVAPDGPSKSLMLWLSSAS